LTFRDTFGIQTQQTVHMTTISGAFGVCNVFSLPIDHSA